VDLTTPRQLPVPDIGPEAAVDWVAGHLGDLVDGAVNASPTFRGGQTAADEALGAFDVAGYADDRNEVWPPSRRGASGLSPWIRHGLLPLRRVWDRVADGPDRDVAKFRDELLWQEYARHLYARLGTRTGTSLRHGVPERAGAVPPWPPSDRLACIDLVVDELATDGWTPNQARLWLSSHWAVRLAGGWRDGEDWMFARLLDGSRAANRLGWQWTTGAAGRPPYEFTRRQVERRAPGLCGGCPRRHDCPIETGPDAGAGPPAGTPVTPDDRLGRWPDDDAVAGPRSVAGSGADPEAVWITAESLGDADPALAARPDLPAVFVFDAPLLARLLLAGTRLVFLAECLADLATRRPVDVWRGDPSRVVGASTGPVAVSFAPVPGWRRHAAVVAPAEIHPWPWLVRPDGAPLRSFTSWRQSSLR
jgi:deoxyribodipyrimidine photo-lyase